MTAIKTLVACLALANLGYFLWSGGVGDAQAPPSSAAPIAAGLTLASESGAAPGGGAPGAARASAGPSVPPPSATESAEPAGGLLTDVKRCISVGPFRDVAETARAATTLRAGGYDPRQRVAEGEVWAGVWVYLPVTPARGSEQMQTRLKASGIDDALEMPGPGEGSVLSLGLYGDARRAQLRVAQLQALGFNPGIADRKRTGDVYWIDIDLKPTDSVLKPSDLQADAGRIVRLEVKACPAPQRDGAP